MNIRNKTADDCKIPVEVITRDLSDLDAPAKRRIIDHDLHSDRVWLGKHAFWAVRNNHSIMTAPVKND